jgi:FkbM family methyltransferase
MNGGDSAVYFADKGSRMVFGIEPYIESFKIACRNIQANGFDKVVTPLNLALSNASGKAKMDILTESSAKIRMHEVNSGSFVGDVEPYLEVQTISLGDLLDQLAVERIDFLKMDCEGCEYDVLCTCNESVMAKISSIKLEFHRGPSPLVEVLAKAGFEVFLDRRKQIGYLTAKKS